MENDSLYKAEYSKSSRALCKGCRTKIEAGVLRFAIMIKSAFHNGSQPNWFHEDCFFKNRFGISAVEIENFESLRFEDKERVQKEIDNGLSVVPIRSSKKDGKRSKQVNAALKDFGVEYAKSGRASCRGCKQKILKDQLRIRRTVYDTEAGLQYGGQPFWHHVECFAQLRGELGWFDTGANLPGFKSLKSEDQAEVKKAIPIMESEDIPETKRAKIKKIDEEDSEASKELKKIKKNKRKN